MAIARSSLGLHCMCCKVASHVHLLHMPLVSYRQGPVVQVSRRLRLEMGVCTTKEANQHCSCNVMQLIMVAAIPARIQLKLMPCIGPYCYPAGRVRL